MPTLADLRRARRLDADATKRVHAAHRVALNCYTYNDENCLCDCGCPRSNHAFPKAGSPMLSRGGFELERGECTRCSCVRYAPAESFRCEYCGNDVRVGRDEDHCNDCLILEVDKARELAK